MSTDATTADEFRVGRRVKVLPGYKDGGREGRLVPRKDAKENDNFWHLQFGDNEPALVHSWHTSVLELLPDDEPDAPATPESRFKPGDEVQVMAHGSPWHGWIGKVVPPQITDEAPDAFWVDLPGHPQRFAGDQLRPEPPPPLTEAFRQLREAAGGRWEGVDAIEYVREMRGYGPEPDHSVDANKMAEPPTDSKPDHYAALRDAGCEPWDVMAAAYPADWCLAYNVLTALVYLQRCKLKHPTPDDDVRKAHAHLGEAARILDSKSTQ